MKLPYSDATSGRNAVEDMRKMLSHFGCTSFGSMEDFASGKLIVQFEHRGRRVTVEASSKGYAAAWLRENPFTGRRSGTRQQYEEKALVKGQVAVCSILRDWIEGQIVAIECGILSFEGAFLGQIMLPNGNTVLQQIQKDDVLQIECRAA